MEFLGALGVGTPHFHCQGHGFNSWWGNIFPTNHMVWPKKKKKNLKASQQDL